jgi:uncharacterized protein
MRLIEITRRQGLRIDSYGPGGFRIEGVWHEGSVIVTPAGVGRFEGPVGRETIATLLAQAAEIDVVLIGQGPDFAPLARPARLALEEAGIGVEVMATGAACRTYNLLLAEDRRVAAVLVAL